MSEHIKNILAEGELQEEAVVRKFRTTGADGKMYSTIHYNLDLILKSNGNELLEGSGSVSHAEAMEKATTEYRKWQNANFSPVEKAYIEEINKLNAKTKKK